MKKKRYTDKRDWKTYNQKLVKRGEFYINPRFLDTWLDETRAMNAKKEGSPYQYPTSLIEFAAMLHAKAFDYRAVEGVFHALSRKFNQFPVISYPQISRRVNQLELKFATQTESITGVDASGIKVSNRGDWMRHKWNVKRGWIKVVVLGDTKGNIVDVRIGNEDLDEKKSARGMARKNKKRIKKLLADGFYDTRSMFNLCHHLGIDPIIKIRKNASTKSKGSMTRKQKVEEYKQLGHEQGLKRLDMDYGGSVLKESSLL